MTDHDGNPWKQQMRVFNNGKGDGKLSKKEKEAETGGDTLRSTNSIFESASIFGEVNPKLAEKRQNYTMDSSRSRSLKTRKSSKEPKPVVTPKNDYDPRNDITPLGFDVIETEETGSSKYGRARLDSDDFNRLVERKEHIKKASETLNVGLTDNIQINAKKNVEIRKALEAMEDNDVKAKTPSKKCSTIDLGTASIELFPDDSVVTGVGKSVTLDLDQPINEKTDRRDREERKHNKKYRVHPKNCTDVPESPLRMTRSQGAINWSPDRSSGDEYPTDSDCMPVAIENRRRSVGFKPDEKRKRVSITEPPRRRENSETQPYDENYIMYGTDDESSVSGDDSSPMMKMNKHKRVQGSITARRNNISENILNRTKTLVLHVDDENKLVTNIDPTVRLQLNSDESALDQVVVCADNTRERSEKRQSTARQAEAPPQMSAMQEQLGKALFVRRKTAVITEVTYDNEDISNFMKKHRSVADRVDGPTVTKKNV